MSFSNEKNKIYFISPDMPKTSVDSTKFPWETEKESQERIKIEKNCVNLGNENLAIEITNFLNEQYY